MFGQSAMMAAAGMGTVFGFLIIMIVAVTLTGKIIRALGADKDVQPAAEPTAARAGSNAEVTAAITAAVNEYKKNN